MSNPVWTPPPLSLSSSQIHIQMHIQNGGTQRQTHTHTHTHTHFPSKYRTFTQAISFGHSCTMLRTQKPLQKALKVCTLHIVWVYCCFQLSLSKDRSSSTHHTAVGAIRPSATWQHSQSAHTAAVLQPENTSECQFAIHEKTSVTMANDCSTWRHM